MKILSNLRRIWIFTFEMEGIAKVGGLGAAVARHASALASAGFDVSVFMPSHGRHFSPEHRRMGLENINWFRCSGSRKGTDGTHRPCLIGAEQLHYKGYKIVMFKGLDEVTGRALDSWNIYQNLEEKASLMVRAALCWLNQANETPDVIIAHDAHAGLTGSALKIEIEKSGRIIPYIYFIHLLSSSAFTWHYASPEWSGISETTTQVWRSMKHETIGTGDLWNSLGGKLDLFNIHLADSIATVSRGYLSEILSKYGDWLRAKSCVAHNTTSWNSESTSKFLEHRYGTADRLSIKWKVLEDFMRDAEPSHGSLERKGLLVVASGRFTFQKGFDTLLRALDWARSDVKVLIAGIPVGDGVYEENLRRLTEKLGGRAALAFGKPSPEMLQAIIYVANVYVAPSRYEPFGIASIEAQALGTPVAAASVHGLPETVIDLLGDERGTAILFSPEDAGGLMNAVTALAIISDAADRLETHKLNEIPMEHLRRIVLANPEIAFKIRKRAAAWVKDSFNDRELAKSLRQCLEMTKRMADFRAASLPR